MANQIKPLKKFGQNFLINEEYAEKIVDSMQNRKEDIIIEIGPGEGVLTQFLIKGKYNRLIAIEIDPRLSELLEKKFGKKITIVQENVLNIPFSNFYSKNGIKIIGNIPYHITSQILFKIFDSAKNVSQAVLMVQKEVADRLLAKPKTKAYSFLTIMAQYHTDVQKILEVNKDQFYPPPKVDSTVVSLMPKEHMIELYDYRLFKQIVISAFQQRRKMIRNSLKKILQVNESGKIRSINLNHRPEELSIQQYINLSNEISIIRNN
jgi:16S rRNA (adenine1518-N6/adenine1519-N6)-dimethyltransferase